MPEFDHLDIEKKMQAYWEEIDAFKADDDSDKPKAYVLDMFPYPSGAGLHVGHVEGYSATDIYARYKRMKGFEVLHPMGWDAFGLPAENYAIKINKHPRIATDENIQNFIKQVKSIGKSIDWTREVDTSSEEYYKWTQWFFLFLYKHGLAYRKESPVNWCDTDQTVLANEQVVEGKCERCSNEVVKKNLPQWFFKVTDYAERLLNDLEPLDWPESLKEMQRNWIGKSEGINFKCKIKDFDFEFEVYDSVPQTYMAQTFSVIAPEHPELMKLVEGTEYEEEVKAFVEKIAKKKISGDFDADKDVEGVFTGRYVEDPYGTGDLPLWVASFVVADYGTGIVNCSAHDTRDFEFAKKYDIPLHPVMFPADPEEAEKVRNLEYCYYKDPDGVMEEPAEFKGQRWEDVREPVIKKLVDSGKGRESTQYKIRDWLISRQRFWGAPIPIIYCDDCGVVPVPEGQLPVKLPKEADFKLKGDGKSPLARVPEFVNVDCPKCGGKGKRETDTMDGFVDNSWYFFRYLDPKNDKEFASKEKLAKWMPVDLYIGGAEHAVGHLIYSRFFTKVLKDQGYITFDEPFVKLVNQGIILAEDSRKMSKRWGNVINPDDVVKEYGADTLRMYEMFLGPLQDSKPWDAKGIVGVRRFLDKVWRLFEEGGVRADIAADDELTALLHKTIDKVTNDIEGLRFNTAISAMMEFINAAGKKGELPKIEAEVFLKILSPFAPHLAEYLWKELGNEGSIAKEDWPVADERLLKDETVTLAIQVNGKVRGKIEISPEAIEAEAKAAALEVESVAKYVEGKEIKKVIYVAGRIINLLV